MDESILDNDFLKVETKYVFNRKILMIWGIILFIGMAFKTMHWPFSNVIIVISSAAITAFSINGLIWSKGKDVLSLVLSVMSVLWFLIFLLGVYGHNGRPYNKFGLTVFSCSLVVFFILYYLISRFKENKRKKK